MKVLVTGASGTFGTALIKHLLQHEPIEKIVAYSRNESKQAERKAEIDDERVQWMIGDVRDRDRLYDAFHRIDSVIHAAALKRVDDNDPMELYRTNVEGTMNVVRCAIQRNTSKVLVLSTDKACAPATAYGASKQMAEFYSVYANKWGNPQVRISATRWGNVIASAGSVLHKWRSEDVLSITDPDSTRFLLTVQQAVAHAVRFFNFMLGGEIFVPALPSCSVRNLAEAAFPNKKTQTIGLRCGEKRHEVLVSYDEVPRTYYQEGFYVIESPHIRTHRWCKFKSPVLNQVSSAMGGIMTIEGIRALLKEAGWTS